VAFETYQQLRQAEDVQDVIYNVSPVDNPAAAMARTIRATGKLHEWTEDVLQAAGKNAAVEGADAGADQSQSVSELNNYTQIMTKVARISGTLEEVDKYGRDSEMAYQLELRYGELANDEELAIIGAPAGGRQVAVGGAVGTAREMACFQTQMANGRNGSALVIDATAATTFAAIETSLLNGHEACYDLGGNPAYLIVPPKVSRYIAGFVNSSTRRRDFGTGTVIVNVVDLYVSPFGELDVVLDRNCERTAQAGATLNIMAGIDFQYLATPVLRATRDYPLARTGDAENRQVLRESSLSVLNTDAHFLIENVSNTATS
jgi:hypothetical protein